MAAHLKISYSTIQKCMNRCIEMKLIKPYKNGYIIMLDCFDKGNTNYFPKGTPPLYKDIYNTIDLFCQTKGIATPPYKRKFISMIAAKYPETERDLQKYNDIEVIK